MDLPTIKPVDGDSRDSAVVRHSSIDQYNDFPLTVIKGGVAIPVSFDYIDSVGCECINTHRAILSNGDDIGYNFPVRKCRFVSDTYVVFDRDGEVIKPLPEWTGMSGFYKEYVTGAAMANFDGASLGQRNSEDLSVGLDYILAGATLVAAE